MKFFTDISSRISEEMIGDFDVLDELGRDKSGIYDSALHVLGDKSSACYLWSLSDEMLCWTSGFTLTGRSVVPGYGVSQAEINKNLNPQDVPKRIQWLNDYLNRLNDMGATDDKPITDSLCYRVFMPDGTGRMVEERLISSVNERKTIIFGIIQDVEQASIVDKTDFVSISVPPQSPRDKIGDIIDETLDHQRAGTVNGPSVGYCLAVGIDRIALFNDQYGTKFTDCLLDEIASRLQALSGNHGHVERLGGDVFAIAFSYAPHNEISSIAQYILKDLMEKPFQIDGRHVRASCSIGGVCFDKMEKVSGPDVLARAEAALGEAKRNGRGCFVSYTSIRHQARQVSRLLDKGNAFIEALHDDRVSLAFQPVMNAKNGCVSFHECLIRMKDQQGRMIAAAEFIPAIEHMGLARMVDYFAIRQAIKELIFFPELSLSVNVSNASLADTDWLRSIVAALRYSPDVAQRLIIEVTESMAVKDVSQAIRYLKTLQDLGCRIALDDFGAGHTTFSQIRDFDVDVIKIDKSFIRNIHDKQNYLFVKVLQALADGVDVETVAEGAETPEEARMLADDGIHHIQGYVYGIPNTERVWLPKTHIHRKGKIEIDWGQELT